MFSTLVAVLLAMAGVGLLMHRIGMWAVWRYTARATRTIRLVRGG